MGVLFERLRRRLNDTTDTTDTADTTNTADTTTTNTANITNTANTANIRIVYCRHVGRFTPNGEKKMYKAISVSDNINPEITFEARRSIPRYGGYDIYVDLDDRTNHIAPAYVYGIHRRAP